MGYYYYLKNNIFDTVCIIHDSVFINSNIDTNIDCYKILWSFEHNWDNENREIELLSYINDQNLINFYNNKDKWFGCFGLMTIISHKYLSFLDEKYNFENILNYIRNREDRMCFERIFACMLQYNYPRSVFLGNIHKYCMYGTSFEELETVKHLPIIKVWTYR